MSKNNFSELFNKYRLRAQFETLSQLGEALVHEGIIYEDSIFSRWKNGSRVPKKRTVLLALIKIFIKHYSINSAEEANELLLSTGLPYLTYSESLDLFKPFSRYSTSSYVAYEITEADVLFLARKILGIPFVLQNEDKIKKLYIIYRKNTKEIVNILQKIETNPSLLEIYASQSTETDLTLHEKIQNEYINALLKKYMRVKILDKHTHIQYS